MHHKTHWTADKVARRIALLEETHLAYRRSTPLPPFHYLELPDPAVPPPLGATVDRSGWTPVEPLTYWSRPRTNFVLHTTFAVPADWEPDQPVALYLPLGEAGDFSHPEALAYIDGVPYAGCDRHHQEVLLPAPWRTGATHQLDLHGWTGLLGSTENTGREALFMRPCLLVQIDVPTREFLATARVALETARALDDNDPAQGRLLNALDAAFKVLDTREPFGAAFYSSVPAAHRVLREGIERAGPPLDVAVIGTGHAHIDVAWLWTLGTDAA